MRRVVSRAQGRLLRLAAMGLLPLAAGCSSPAFEAAPAPVVDAGPADAEVAPPDAGATALAESRPISTTNPADVPIDGTPKVLVATFHDGDALFDTPFRPVDGLGPLYVRDTCGTCHEGGSRGPGFVQKMAAVLADGITPDTVNGPTLLPFGISERPLLAAGASTPILPPPNATSIKVTMRLGPPVLGRSYIEAVPDSEIERVASLQAARTDAIHGRINHVVYASVGSVDPAFHTHVKGDVVVGRYGVKARVATLDDFTADALQGDMGLTSPLRPVELPNPDGLTDDLKPGVDTTSDMVREMATYLRLIAIPLRGTPSPAAVALFDQVKCSACHVPTLHTRSDYPIAILANLDAPVFTDVLLHDMGSLLADGIVDSEAGSRDFRTAPLIGLRFNREFLHDGRARTVESAILQHAGPGSEAAEAVSLYQGLSDQDRQTLLDYVTAL